MSESENRGVVLAETDVVCANCNEVCNFPKGSNERAVWGDKHREHKMVFVYDLEVANSEDYQGNFTEAV